jgi:NAD(P)-dependent dehydrogenase (short-subunit alcohol dehydrogenase family)
MTEHDGRVALVTGAGRGLGRAIALELAARGAAVVAVARTPGDLDSLHQTAIGLPGSIHPTALDVSDAGAVMPALAEVTASLGAVSILVNAAGIFGPIAMIADSDPTEWIRTLDVDLKGPYLTVRACLPGMLEAGWGRIVNISSAASLHPPGPLNSAYGTAKVALNQFTRHLAAEVAGSGVTANVIHPGDVKTDMWADIAGQARALGPVAKPYLDWVDWVAQTGGDPEDKAVRLVLSLVADSPAPRNGEFCWIDDPLQPPIPSWEPVGQRQPWADSAD